MCDDCLKTCNAISELTRNFGDSVMIANVEGYPTAKGRHAVSIVERGKIYEGQTLVECLENAVADMPATSPTKDKNG